MSSDRASRAPKDESSAATPGSAGVLVVVSAPSGAGKSSIIENVLNKMAGLDFSVSYTTRDRRGTETEGVDYHFVTPGQFASMREGGEFLEWAEVHGHLYGTGRAAVESKLREGSDVVLDIDVQGAEQIRTKIPGAVGVFVLPPTAKALKARLAARNLNTPEDLARRLANARVEVRKFELFDYVIINDDLARASAELESIIIAERHRAKRVRQAAEKIIATFGGEQTNG